MVQLPSRLPMADMPASPARPAPRGAGDSSCSPPTQSRPGAPLLRSGVSKRAVVIFWGLSAPNSAIATRSGRVAPKGVPTLPT